MVWHNILLNNINLFLEEGISCCVTNFWIILFSYKLIYLNFIIYFIIWPPVHNYVYQIVLLLSVYPHYIFYVFFPYYIRQFINAILKTINLRKRDKLNKNIFFLITFCISCKPRWPPPPSKPYVLNIKQVGLWSHCHFKITSS